jgi:glycosyltransferase involved in cell wall biosynthesis
MTSTNPLVSIVIPIYNVEFYLDDCLNSLMKQAYQNWQAILVNDGSPDNSADIAAKFCQLDPRFQLINQENKGLGGARNTGVKHAIGEYLFFLDSDDIITGTALTEMVTLLENNKDADLVIGGLHDFYNNRPSRSDTALQPNNIYLNLKLKVGERFSFIQQKVEAVDQLNFYLCIANCKLFRLALWNKLQCQSPSDLRMAEDFIPVKKYIYSSHSVLFLNNAVIQYRNRHDSASKHKSNNAFEVFRALPLFINELTEIDHYPKNKASWNLFLFNMLVIHYFFCPTDRKMEYINKLRENISSIGNDSSWCHLFIFFKNRAMLFRCFFNFFLFYQYTVMPFVRYVKRVIYNKVPNLAKLIKGWG